VKIKLGVIMKVRISNLQFLVILVFLFSGSMLAGAERIVVDWEWDTAPIEMVEHNRADFQGEHQAPIAVSGVEDDRIYLIQRIFSTEGNLYTASISSEGEIVEEIADYPGISAALIQEPLTGNCLGVFTASDGMDYENNLFYNQYAQSGIPLSWIHPAIVVIDEDTPTFTDNDTFRFPQLVIGASPEGASYRRLYYIARNMECSDGEMALPSENAVIAYLDYNAEDMLAGEFEDWTYISIPTLDGWNQEVPEWGYPHYSITAVDNYLVCMGSVRLDEQAFGDMFCLVNDNYGEGDWEVYQSDWAFDITEEAGEVLPATMRVYQIEFLSDKFNMLPVNRDGEQLVCWAGNMGIVFDLVNHIGWYDPVNQMVYPKLFNFNLTTEEFGFTDIYPAGAAANDDNPMLPWDLDEDGEVDEYDPGNNPMWVHGWPIFYPGMESAFYTNENFIASNSDEGWLAYVWVDGTNAQRFYYGDENYEEWAEYSEIAICVSGDNGITWSEPVFLNGNPNSENFVAELEDKTLCIVYPAERITDAGDGTGILHLSIIGDSDMEMFNWSDAITYYASLAIDFESVSEVSAEEISSGIGKITNYPNPFNPETKIIYEVAATGDVNLSIYNIRGQKITELVNEHKAEGEYEVNWRADDVPSGVYFVRMKSAGWQGVHKLVLMK